ncbi:cation diffusion facilitator family transporter [Paenibacillus sp. N3/727]|uniref:cation diffusion facilitator family transporter n=1 Tax=Paenibacillus sp. N3/727 TaxID=2925845 RepID=UPI001F5372F5|nr:cation diffusion facilitator family transporter [Paenibacillus sp. N3/727]UNK18901.1 cation diffusion facilitator family transporter [Paenibacillus sp. N3/727]
MSHSHSHDHHGHNHGHQHAHGHGGKNNAKGLTFALIITSSIMVLEFFGGLITNSLALLSDSGHMLSDVAALALSLVAMWFATRPASPSKTYGFFRFEILAALFNGISLFVIAGFICWEAYGRFMEPPTVASGSMMLIAFIGLLANLLSAWSLMRKSDIKNNINVRSAYLHVIGDALGSVGAIVAGLLMWLFDWYIADPIVSVFVALLILKGAWNVIKTTIHVLMEGTPASIDQEQVIQTLMEIDGVIDVHDLHIWTITSGLDSLSCHLKITDQADSQRVLQQAIIRIEERFKIQHITIQVEQSHILHPEFKV